MEGRLTPKANYFHWTWLELANGELLDEGKEVFIPEYSEFFWRNSEHE